MMSSEHEKCRITSSGLLLYVQPCMWFTGFPDKLLKVLNKEALTVITSKDNQMQQCWATQVLTELCFFWECCIFEGGSKSDGSALTWVCWRSFTFDDLFLPLWSRKLCQQNQEFMKKLCVQRRCRVHTLRSHLRMEWCRSVSRVLRSAARVFALLSSFSASLSASAPLVWHQVWAGGVHFVGIPSQACKRWFITKRS